MRDGTIDGNHVHDTPLLGQGLRTCVPHAQFRRLENGWFRFHGRGHTTCRGLHIPRCWSIHRVQSLVVANNDWQKVLKIEYTLIVLEFEVRGCTAGMISKISIMTFAMALMLVPNLWKLRDMVQIQSQTLPAITAKEWTNMQALSPLTSLILCSVPYVPHRSFCVVCPVPVSWTLGPVPLSMRPGLPSPNRKFPVSRHINLVVKCSKALKILRPTYCCVHDI